MESKYLVYDVETANDDKSSICQIGLVFLDENFNEIESKRFGELINPEDEFEYYYHTRIHGIDEKTIKKEHPETFDKFWAKYKDEFLNNTLVFHSNNNFDLNSLKEALSKYHINYSDNDFARYIDTQKWIINVTNRELKPYKLPIICGRLELPVYEHHDATNDALMCAGLFRWLNDVDTEKARLTSNNGGKLKSHKSSGRPLKPEQIKMSELLNLLGGIVEDDIVSKEEFENLRDSIDDYSMLEGLYPYDEIINILDEFAVVNDSNSRELYRRILETIDIKQKEDFFEPKGTKISFEGKTFLLTNIFFKGVREDIEKRIVALGGLMAGTKADYLIIGGQMNYQNKYILYNDKMITAYNNKAVKKKGNMILDEMTFIENLNNYSNPNLNDIISKFIDENLREDLIIQETQFGYSVRINSSVLVRIYTDKKNIYRFEFIKNSDTSEYFKNSKIAIEKDSVYQIDYDKEGTDIIKCLNELSEPINIQAKRIATNVRVESFGCCGHYLECSDARKCIMADFDKDFYRGCQYRKNLEFGKIFYGNNANVK